MTDAPHPAGFQLGKPLKPFCSQGKCTGEELPNVCLKYLAHHRTIWVNGHFSLSGDHQLPRTWDPSAQSGRAVGWNGGASWV